MVRGHLEAVTAFYKYIVVMDAQPYEDTESHRLVYFKWMDYMECALCLNKAVFHK